MRHLRGLITLAILGAGAFSIWGSPSPLSSADQKAVQTRLNQTYREVSTTVQYLAQSAYNNLTNQPTETTTNQATNTAQSQLNTDMANVQATPIESLVQNVKLQNTYYYHFSKSVTPAIKAVFQYAVQVYNQTGIVNLVPGEGGTTKNEITFTTYNRDEKSQTTGTIELGEGGPEIITHSLGILPTVNHGTAMLNTRYARAIARSVAIHELGHVLGLGHSTDRSSVMYPIDQGHTQLSAGDIKALLDIYQKK